MKKASAVFFILVLMLGGLSSCNSAARKAKKCDCPRFGQQQPEHSRNGTPG